MEIQHEHYEYVIMDATKTTAHTPMYYVIARVDSELHKARSVFAEKIDKSTAGEFFTKNDKKYKITVFAKLTIEEVKP